MAFDRPRGPSDDGEGRDNPNDPKERTLPEQDGDVDDPWRPRTDAEIEAAYAEAAAAIREERAKNPRTLFGKPSVGEARPDTGTDTHEQKPYSLAVGREREDDPSPSLRPDAEASRLSRAEHRGKIAALDEKDDGDKTTNAEASEKPDRDGWSGADYRAEIDRLKQATSELEIEYVRLRAAGALSDDRPVSPIDDHDRLRQALAERDRDRVAELRDLGEEEEARIEGREPDYEAAQRDPTFEELKQLADAEEAKYAEQKRTEVSGTDRNGDTDASVETTEGPGGEDRPDSGSSEDRPDSPAAIQEARDHPKEYAAARAAELQAMLPEARRGRITMGVGVGTDADGCTRVVIGTSEDNGYMRKPIRPKAGEEIAEGKGHAETSILDYMADKEIRPSYIAAGRPICPPCADSVDTAGAQPASPLKIVKEDRQ